MPYIKEENRQTLDDCISNMVRCLELNAFRASYNKSDTTKLGQKISNEDLLEIAGDINYTFSRILAGLMGQVSYSKIAIITGVLENIKQEFYRRIAEPYEELKIRQNGDIKEYRG